LVEAPEQPYDFDEGAGLLSLNIRLHQYVRRAAVYRVNTVKRFVRPIHATISGAEPTEERRGRPTARHAHRSSVALEFTDVSSFVNIVRSFGSLAPPSFTLITSPIDSARFGAYRPIHAIRMVARSNHLPDLSSELF